LAGEGARLRLESFDHYEVDAFKLGAMGAALAACALVACDLAFGPALGSTALEVALVVGGLVFYLVLSTPRRALDRERISQARGSVRLSAAAGAFLSATGSKARTLLMLGSREQGLERVLAAARKRVLLGAGCEEAAGAAADAVASSAAAAVLRRVSAFGFEEVAAEGEETQGISRSASLGRETKLPVYMTLCFFAPVVLLLYSDFAHLVDVSSLIALFALEVVVLDLAFYVCSSDGRPG
jgi:hypothetical protein